MFLQTFFAYTLMLRQDGMKMHKRLLGMFIKNREMKGIHTFLVKYILQCKRKSTFATSESWYIAIFIIQNNYNNLFSLKNQKLEIL